MNDNLYINGSNDNSLIEDNLNNNDCLCRVVKCLVKNCGVTKEFNKDIGTGIVLCMIREITPIDEHNYFVPIEYL